MMLSKQLEPNLSAFEIRKESELKANAAFAMQNVERPAQELQNIYFVFPRHKMHVDIYNELPHYEILRQERI